MMHHATNENVRVYWAAGENLVNLLHEAAVFLANTNEEFTWANVQSSKVDDDDVVTVYLHA